MSGISICVGTSNGGTADTDAFDVNRKTTQFTPAGTVSPIASKSSLARGRGIFIEPRDALDEAPHLLAGTRAPRAWGYCGR
jgi:hypothetical protein